jgi:hypothetical protein
MDRKESRILLGPLGMNWGQGSPPGVPGIQEVGKRVLVPGLPFALPKEGWLRWLVSPHLGLD